MILILDAGYSMLDAGQIVDDLAPMGRLILGLNYNVRARLGFPISWGNE